MSTSDLNAVRHGLYLLDEYDDTNGSVDVSDDRAIYAGPQEEPGEPSRVDKTDALVLRGMGWEYDEDIGRWGFRP